MNFIELTRRDDQSTPIHINTAMITALVENTDFDSSKTTTVYLMGGQISTVSETVEEIKERIKETETFKMTTFYPR